MREVQVCEKAFGYNIGGTQFKDMTEDRKEELIDTFRSGLGNGKNQVLMCECPLTSPGEDSHFCRLEEIPVSFFTSCKEGEEEVSGPSLKSDRLCKLREGNCLPLDTDFQYHFHKFDQRGICSKTEECISGSEMKDGRCQLQLPEEGKNLFQRGKDSDGEKVIDPRLMDDNTVIQKPFSNIESEFINVWEKKGFNRIDTLEPEPVPSSKSEWNTILKGEEEDCYYEKDGLVLSRCRERVTFP